MLLELEEYVPEDEDEDEEDELEETTAEEETTIGEEGSGEAPDRDRLRVWASREQMLALSRHGAEVAARGRPRCQFCGNPIDPDGHTCPAMNGHRSPTRG